MTDLTTKAQPKEHEIDCFYRGSHGKPYYQPSFSCSCGFMCREVSWQEAGAELDRHLERLRGPR